MIKKSHTVIIAVGVLLLALATTASTHTAPEEPTGYPTTLGSASLAHYRLDHLHTAPTEDTPDYDRALFPHWSTVHSTCNTREWTLLRDGSRVTVNNACHPLHGTWHSAYDDRTLTDSRDVDIDHLVPLSHAWHAGAWAWTTDQRRAFANDTASPQLWAVSASTNRSKGDRAPDEWMPPHTGTWCAYTKAWIAVKHTWKLTATPDEHTTLRVLLNQHC